MTTAPAPATATAEGGEEMSIAATYLDNLAFSASVPKPIAGDTMFRCSDAGKCERALGYSATGVPKAALDGASAHVMAIGVDTHERFQRFRLHDVKADAKAVKADAEASDKSGAPREEAEALCEINDLVSGRCDLLIESFPDRGRVVVELKSVGAFAFDRAIGIQRAKYARTTPEGPRSAAKVQGALYAAARDADWLCIIYLSTEAISRQLGARFHLDDHERVSAEWWYPRSEFGLWAAAEVRRLAALRERLGSGELGERVCVGDEMEKVRLVPEGRSPNWQCVYCGHRETCVADGPDPR